MGSGFVSDLGALIEKQGVNFSNGKMIRA